MAEWILRLVLGTVRMSVRKFLEAKSFKLPAFFRTVFNEQKSDRNMCPLW